MPSVSLTAQPGSLAAQPLLRRKADSQLTETAPSPAGWAEATAVPSMDFPPSPGPTLRGLGQAPAELVARLYLQKLGGGSGIVQNFKVLARNIGTKRLGCVSLSLSLSFLAQALFIFAELNP